MQAIIGERIGQRLDDMGLADQLLEPPRPPFARQNRVTHAQVSGNERSAPARPRHPTGLLPLLPSGPDGVYSWLSRGNRRGPSLLYQLGFGPCDSSAAPFVSAFRSGLRCRPCALGATRKFRRGGRVVEGARLESVYTPKRRIEGSNPSLSATIYLKR